jgi:BASS family bile acid:Na+ symporter
VLPAADTIVRILTTCSLGGLLLAVGLRLRWSDIAAALASCRIARIGIANFLVVPALGLVLSDVMQLSADWSVGMLLLAAAPFAPVVPVFARLARADLALSAGLTSMFPVLSAVFTPVVLQFGLPWLRGSESFQFRPWVVLGVLLATITLPLAVGVAANHLWPSLRRRFLQPLEVTAEAMGALSLLFVTVIQFRTIVDTPWPALVATVIFFEVSFLLGYALGGAEPGRRLVIAIGTSNRNIALALLVALDSFAGTTIQGVVVTIGLLLILSGLLHVAWYRFFGFGSTLVGASRTEG